MKNDKMKLKNF